VVTRTDVTGEAACEFRERWASAGEGGLPDAVEVKLSVSGIRDAGASEATLELDTETVAALIPISAGGTVPCDE